MDSSILDPNLGYETEKSTGQQINFDKFSFQKDISHSFVLKTKLREPREFTSLFCAKQLYYNFTEVADTLTTCLAGKRPKLNNPYTLAQRADILHWLFQYFICKQSSAHIPPGMLISSIANILSHTEVTGKPCWISTLSQLHRAAGAEKGYSL